MFVSAVGVNDINITTWIIAIYCIIIISIIIVNIMNHPGIGYNKE